MVGFLLGIHHWHFKRIKTNVQKHSLSRKGSALQSFSLYPCLEANTLYLAFFLELSNRLSINLVRMYLGIKVQYLLISLQLDGLWILLQAVKVCFMPLIPGSLAGLLRQENSVVPVTVSTRVWTGELRCDALPTLSAHKPQAPLQLCLYRSVVGRRLVWLRLPLLGWHLVCWWEDEDARRLRSV